MNDGTVVQGQVSGGDMEDLAFRCHEDRLDILGAIAANAAAGWLTRRMANGRPGGWVSCCIGEHVNEL